jgi:hypothetical protein
MHERMQTNRKGRGVAGGSLLALLLIVVPAKAFAQTAPPGEAPPTAAPNPGETAGASAAAAPPLTEQPPPPQPPAPPPPPAPAAAPVELPFGTVPKGPVPFAWPPAMPNVDFGGRIRTAVRFQGFSDPHKLNDVAATLYADLYMTGQLNRMWKWLLAVTSNDYGGTAGALSTIPVSILDAIAGFTPLPEFQIYAGRLLVMADRYAPSGPWSMDEWFYPGFFVGTPPAVPKAGPSGRDMGVVAWGAPLGGHVKYYLGAYQLQDPALSPLLSGRVQVSLLSREPGWFQRTTYYGERDLVAIGIGGQIQNNGSVMAMPPAMAGMTPPPALLDDYREVNADLIVEKRFGGLGALSLEGAYYNFQGTYQPWKWSMVAAIAYNSPILTGIGQLRPSFRFQQAEAKQVTAAGESFDPTRVYDAQLTYSVMQWYAHVVVNYRHYDVVYASTSAAAPAAAPPHSTGNMIVVGVQLWDP